MSDAVGVLAFIVLSGCWDGRHNKSTTNPVMSPASPKTESVPEEVVTADRLWSTPAISEDGTYVISIEPREERFQLILYNVRDTNFTFNNERSGFFGADDRVRVNSRIDAWLDKTAEMGHGRWHLMTRFSRRPDTITDGKAKWDRALPGPKETWEVGHYRLLVMRAHWGKEPTALIHHFVLVDLLHPDDWSEISRESILSNEVADECDPSKVTDTIRKVAFDPVRRAMLLQKTPAGDETQFEPCGLTSDAYVFGIPRRAFPHLEPPELESP